MAKHIFVANAPGVIQTTRGRYRLEAAGDILHLTDSEATQVRAATFAQRNLLTYLGVDEDPNAKHAGATAVPVKKKPKAAPVEEPSLGE